MARRPRTELPDWIHHVTCRGPTELHPFPDPEEREQFLGGVGKVASEYGWSSLAYSTLTTHYHLVVHVPDESLGAGMQKLHTRYARWLNARLGRRGRVWADRFYSRPVQSPQHLANAIVYVDLNALDAGLATRVAEWRWDSVRANTGQDQPRAWHDPERARAAVGLSGPRAAELYRAILSSRVSPGGLSLGGHPSDRPRLYDPGP